MINGIFDSHAHYDDESYDIDRDTLINELFSKSVCGIINVGASIESSKASVGLSQRYEKIYAAVGIHPQEADSFQDLSEIEALAESAVAIGEIGLDYHYQPYAREKQMELFESQLILANKLDLPVIIHSRDATQDSIDLVKKHKPRGVFHCFSGSAEVARELLQMGFYLGFTGVATFKNARRALEAIECTPLDRLLLETDCPYMAPEPHRGERCQSDMIEFTAAAMARVKGIAPQEMVDAARGNTKRLFDVD